VASLFRRLAPQAQDAERAVPDLDRMVVGKVLGREVTENSSVRSRKPSREGGFAIGVQTVKQHVGHSKSSPVSASSRDGRRARLLETRHNLWVIPNCKLRGLVVFVRSADAAPHTR
jgi:hypothetical protein